MQPELGDQDNNPQWIFDVFGVGGTRRYVMLLRNWFQSLSQWSNITLLSDFRFRKNTSMNNNFIEFDLLLIHCKILLYFHQNYIINFIMRQTNFITLAHIIRAKMKYIYSCRKKNVDLLISFLAWLFYRIHHCPPLCFRIVVIVCFWKVD